ncbi:MAG: hypothetical protein FWD49_01310 [Firmicutes bacterium]|nr:hypothetical protein [Bacillota bacterium]
MKTQTSLLMKPFTSFTCEELLRNMAECLYIIIHHAGLPALHKAKPASQA